MENDLSTIEEKLRCLRNASVFATLSDDLLSGIATSLEALTVPAGTAIVVKDEPGDSFYIIASGQVRVHDGELIINTLGPGAIFGEMAVLAPAPRSATVTSETETTVYWLNQRHLNKLMDERIEVAHEIISTLCGHLRELIEDRTRDFSYIRQMDQITAAAAALESGSYTPESLKEVAQRNDSLGNLARVFQRMANEVQARERHLSQQVQVLRIEVDQKRKAQQVADITSSTFFQTLRQKARGWKRK